MASRYWVGGTALWDGTAGSKWSATSGGASGASVPTGSDDVFLDAASGAVTISISGTRSFKSLNCTGFTGTLRRNTPGANDTVDIFQPAISGTVAITLVAGMTVTPGDLVFKFNSGAGTMTFTSAGKSLKLLLITFGTLTLADAMVCTESFASGDPAVVNTGGFALTAPLIAFTGGTVTLGASTLTATGTGDCFQVDPSVAFNAGTSTIKLTNNSSTGKSFAGGGQTFNNVWIATGGSGVTRFTGSNTFNDLKIDAGRSVQFEILYDEDLDTYTGTTQTVSSLTATGSSGNLITMFGDEPGVPWYISKASGTVTCDYLDLTDSAAIGGAIFVPGTNSVDSGGNSGWSFSTSVVGAAAITESGDTLSSAATLALKAAGAISEADDTLVSAAVMVVPGTGTATITEDDDTLSSVGKLLITAVVLITESGDVLSASSVPAGLGAFAVTEADDTLNAAAIMASPADFFTRVLLSRETGEAIIILITITHDELEEPLRVCLNQLGHDVVSQGETYLATFFDVILVSDTDQAPSAQVRVANVNREIGAILDGLDSAPMMRIDVVLASHPDRIERSFKQLKLKRASWDASMVEGELGGRDFQNTPWPGMAATPALFPALFK